MLVNTLSSIKQMNILQVYLQTAKSWPFLLHLVLSYSLCLRKLCLLVSMLKEVIEGRVKPMTQASFTLFSLLLPFIDMIVKRNRLLLFLSFIFNEPLSTTTILWTIKNIQSGTGWWAFCVTFCLFLNICAILHTGSAVSDRSQRLHKK